MVCSRFSSRSAIAVRNLSDKITADFSLRRSCRRSTIRITGIWFWSTRWVSASQMILSALGVVVAFQRGGGGAQDNDALPHFCAHHRHVAGMVAGGFLLFVGGFMFFIHHDQTEPLQRREDGAPGPDHDLGFAGVDLVPFVVTLTLRQMAVKHGHDVAILGKAAFESFDGLGRERNFGNENNRAPAAFQSGANCLQINFGFAAAGDAVKKNGPGGCADRPWLGSPRSRPRPVPHSNLDWRWSRIVRPHADRGRPLLPAAR